MTVNLTEKIKTQLALYHDVYLNQSFLTAKAIQSIEIADVIQIEIKLPYPFQSIENQIRGKLESLLLPLSLDKQILLKFSTIIAPHTAKGHLSGLPGIKNIVAIASGKGGVGKSTVALNMALALFQDGARVGLLDADIYGPSQPMMLGVKNERPTLRDSKLVPIMRHGLQTMSIGYLVDQTAAMVWRGPMLGKAMQQLAQDTAWNDLDYLIVDLPPGTGDIQLTLCQKIPLSAAVIVTTPQDLALLDVRRACEMFNKLNIPILGMIENMSVYTCTQCGHVEHLFGEGGGSKLAQEYRTHLLGSIPLNKQIREMTDKGIPLVSEGLKDDYAQTFCEAGRKMAATLSLL